jgi:hypothetical protein
MADTLATPSDLASLLQQDLDASTATLVLECATAVVQEAAGNQRIIQVVDDTAEMIGSTDSWLWLPQRPVSAVTSVTMDGQALTDWTKHGTRGRLYRADGWQAPPVPNAWPGMWPQRSGPWGPFPYGYPQADPSVLVIVYTHGYPTGHQGLQLARQATLALAKMAYVNPDGATQVRIDDYQAAYDAMSSGLTDSLKAALRRKYGRPAGLVRIGG